MASGRLVSYGIRSAQGRTTLRLEPEFWETLGEIAAREGVSKAAILREIDATRGSYGRTSACRTYVLQYCRSAMTDAGHAKAGHSESQKREPVRPDFEAVAPKELMFA